MEMLKNGMFTEWLTKADVSTLHKCIQLINFQFYQFRYSQMEKLDPKLKNNFPLIR